MVYNYKERYKMDKDLLLERLRELCEGISYETMRAVVLGVEETIEEFEGDIFIDLSDEVWELVKKDNKHSELFDQLHNFGIDGTEIENFISCINDGASGEIKVDSDELTDDSLLIEFVIYALEITL